MSFKYFPMAYLIKVKRPNENYVLNQIIGDDLLIIYLGITLTQSNPVFHAISMTILMMSFWCIYEIGYLENDRMGEKFEDNPILSDAYRLEKTSLSISWQPWIWAFGLAIPGILLLGITNLNTFNIVEIGLKLSSHKNLMSSSLHLITWLSLLTFIRVTFWLYNHIDIKSRVWVFPILQATKCFGFLFVTSTNLIGISLFFVQVISRWLPYLVYRYDGNRKNFPKRFSRFFLFMAMILALSFTHFDLLVDELLLVSIICVFLFLRSVNDVSKMLQDSKFMA